MSLVCVCVGVKLPKTNVVSGILEHILASHFHNLHCSLYTHSLLLSISRLLKLYTDTHVGARMRVRVSMCVCMCVKYSCVVIRIIVRPWFPAPRPWVVKVCYSVGEFFIVSDAALMPEKSSMKNKNLDKRKKSLWNSSNYH